MNKELIKERVITALKIREEMHKIYTKHNVSTVLCTEEVNPFYNQIDENADGIICEYYYSCPSKIYTPLGYISITCSYMSMDENADNAIKEIEEKFGFALEREAITNTMGVFGGWYHITKLPWNNNKLQCNCKRRDRKEYISYEEAKKIYSEIIESMGK